MFFEFLDLLLFFWFLGFPRILLLDSSDLSDSSGFFNIFSDSFEICRFLLKSIGFSHILPDSFGSSRIFLVLLAISSDFFRFSAMLSDVLRIVSDSLKFFGFFRTLWDSFGFIRSLSDSFEWFQIFLNSLGFSWFPRSWLDFPVFSEFDRILSYSFVLCRFLFIFFRIPFTYCLWFSQILSNYFRNLLDSLGSFQILQDSLGLYRILSEFV